MKTLSLAYLLLVFLTFSAFKFNPSNAKQTHPISDNNMLNTIDHLLDRIYQWRNEAQESQTFVSWLMVLAGVLCFIASSISSAGGIGGGGLFIPILTIVAGLDLKTASSLSAFMVTGGSIANVMCNLCRKSTKLGKKSLIDYDIALLSEPCMLLGVSVGVICNLVFPEWLITALFAVFLAWCTSKTCNCAMRFWRNESEEMRKKFGLAEKLEKGQPGNEIGTTEENKENEGSKSIEEPLLVPEVNSNERLPWLKLGVLFLVWFSFFSVYLLRGNKYGQSIIPMEPCGLEYWILSSVQVPLAVVFTAWIVFGKERLQDQQECPDLTKNSASHKLVFPLMAFLAGLLGGVFGIGGGMLISPFLLQVGVAPEVTAATCSFMVFFSSVMSALQYLLLGMEHIEIALILATISFIASLLGLLVVQKAIQKYGRTSLIVFSVGIVMSLSAVLMTSFGAIEVWKDYNSGKYMGFKLPC
ncbi:hypothetical protein HN51_057656 [Arachis hypogaea]|uniref:Sulfite exporter TauE/SafE family protein n=1 Tax=Arachis hypogaea TaxID=3818 RepID=A0A444WXT6_ARAHY|nr:sulfite exporter TauE/SafE family protein 5 [Arachis ipaensis]XP_025682973.1 sulfite exporter TauE/SafE family protein 5 [Arachis hypogaea]QHN80457.1 uncharacterized protein DS421_20g678310 [Arachis hypogaea]RYQ82267.1 hypothetical protein Ahy_B10g100866 [Arachis hypogaea]